MTDEVTQENQEQVTTPEQDDAAFAAGFAEARGEEPPIEASEVQAEQKSDQGTAAEEVQEEKPSEPEIVFAGLTEEQLKAQLAKAGEVDELKPRIRELYGRLGTLQGELKQMSQRGHTKVSPEQFKRLKEAWGEETAQALAEDLSEIALIVGNQQAPQFDPTPLVDQLNQSFREELMKVQAQSEAKLLSIRHRDWATVRDSDDFKLWEQQLPAEERQQLNDSWDAMYIADKFDEFKEWRDKAKASKQQKQNRLSNAVTPTGGRAAPVTTINDDDAFMAGFKAVRG